MVCLRFELAHDGRAELTEDDPVVVLAVPVATIAADGFDERTHVFGGPVVNSEIARAERAEFDALAGDV
jgi:hypothetical protein